MFRKTVACISSLCLLVILISLFQNGDSALHLAVRKNKIEIVEALVQCGADLSLRNKVGLFEI